VRTRVWLASGLIVVGLAAIVAVAVAHAARTAGITDQQLITRIAGVPRTGGGFSGDGGPAINAKLYIPRDVAVDVQDNIYIADSANHRVRKIDACTGKITTVAGTGVRGFSGDGGPAVNAQLNLPFGVALDSKRNLYIAEKENSRVRKVTPDGTISTFAGGGRQGVLRGDVPATAASFLGPWDVAVDRHDNVYIAATYQALVLKVTPDGILHRIGGGGRSADPAAKQEGIPARDAYLELVRRLDVDRAGNVYITAAATDSAQYTYNGLLQRIDPAGTITTIAGSRTRLRTDSAPRRGPATQLPLVYPHGVAVDRYGNVFVTEQAASRVRKVAGGEMTLVAGSARGRDARGYSAGDGGPAGGALFQHPEALAFDTRGNMLVADTVNGLIRKIWTATPRARPKLTVTAQAPQRPLVPKAVTLTASCDKPCTITATGSITVGGRTFALTGARTAQSGSSCPAPLVLRIPAGTLADLRGLLEGGATGRATILVRAVDAAGHATTTTRTIPIRA
jgi:DNA-binding beta-propeller fold protein YncE